MTYLYLISRQVTCVCKQFLSFGMSVGESC